MDTNSNGWVVNGLEGRPYFSASFFFFCFFFGLSQENTALLNWAGNTSCTRCDVSNYIIPHLSNTSWSHSHIRPLTVGMADRHCFEEALLSDCK